MKPLSRFVTKFTKLIVALLSCFDRVIFKGYLFISNPQSLEGFIDHVLQIRRCDFMAFAEKQSEIVVDHTKNLAEKSGVDTGTFKAVIARKLLSMTSFDSERSTPD